MPRGNLKKPKYICTSLIIDKELWKQFKIKCIELDRPMQECLEEAITQHISHEVKKA